MGSTNFYLCLVVIPCHWLRMTLAADPLCKKKYLHSRNNCLMAPPNTAPLHYRCFDSGTHYPRKSPLSKLCSHGAFHNVSQTLSCTHCLKTMSRHFSMGNATPDDTMSHLREQKQVMQKIYKFPHCNFSRSNQTMVSGFVARTGQFFTTLVEGC